MDIKKHTKGKKSSVSQNSDIDLNKNSIKKSNKILARSTDQDINKKSTTVDTKILTDSNTNFNLNQLYESNYSLNYSNPTRDNDKKTGKTISNIPLNKKSSKLSNDIIDFKLNNLMVDGESQLNMLEYNKFENCKKLHKLKFENVNSIFVSNFIGKMLKELTNEGLVYTIDVNINDKEIAKYEQILKDWIEKAEKGNFFCSEKLEQHINLAKTEQSDKKSTNSKNQNNIKMDSPNNCNFCNNKKNNANKEDETKQNENINKTLDLENSKVESFENSYFDADILRIKKKYLDKSTERSTKLGKPSANALQKHNNVTPNHNKTEDLNSVSNIQKNANKSFNSGKSKQKFIVENYQEVPEGVRNEIEDIISRNWEKVNNNERGNSENIYDKNNRNLTPNDLSKAKKDQGYTVFNEKSYNLISNNNNPLFKTTNYTKTYNSINKDYIDLKNEKSTYNTTKIKTKYHVSTKSDLNNKTFDTVQANQYTNYKKRTQNTIAKPLLNNSKQNKSVDERTRVYSANPKKAVNTKSGLNQNLLVNDKNLMMFKTAGNFYKPVNNDKSEIYSNIQRKIAEKSKKELSNSYQIDNSKFLNNELKNQPLGRFFYKESRKRVLDEKNKTHNKL